MPLTKEYMTQAGTTFLNPTGTHPDLGSMFYDTIMKYPSIQDEMVDLQRWEGEKASGEEALEGVGFWDTLKSKYWDEDLRSDEDLRGAAMQSIEGLKDMFYLSGYPTRDQGGYVYGEYLHGTSPEIRMNPAVPDTAFFPSPSIITQEYFNPDTGAMDSVSDTITADVGLKSLIHESLLHGLNMGHPPNPFLAPTSQRNYETTSDKIFDTISEEDRARLIDLMYPDDRKTPSVELRTRIK